MLVDKSLTAAALGRPAEKQSIRRLLREATSPFHSQVDIYMEKLLAQADGGYERFLLASARAVLPLERALHQAGVLGVMADWPIRCRSKSLVEDLAALSLLPPNPDDVYKDTRLRNPAFMMGILYVMEGSRFGARLIIDRFGLSRTHHQSIRYLCHGQGLPLWQTFIVQLETSVQVRQTPKLATAGATAGFKAFLPD